MRGKWCPFNNTSTIEDLITPCDNRVVIEGITEHQLETVFMELPKRIVHWISDISLHMVRMLLLARTKIMCVMPMYDGRRIETIKPVKIYKRGAFIEACYDNFFKEIIEYENTNEEPIKFFKKRIQIRICIR